MLLILSIFYTFIFLIISLILLRIIWEFVPDKSKLGVNFICSNCGYRGSHKVVRRGSSLIEVFLWIMIIIPEIVYTLWRITSKYEVCPKCKAPNMVPMDSPRGKKLEAEFKKS
jgi:hypothetical protein